jgi:hypothetical protein
MTWTDQTTGTTADHRAWGAVASDATGTHLVALSTLPLPFCCELDIWTN